MVALTGDGGLGMTLAEIETAVRLRLRIVVIVFNDATLSLIKIKQRPAGQGGAEAVDYGPVSFAGVATAMGAAAAAPGTEAELVTALGAALRRDGPTVIDAAVDPACYPAVMELTRGDACPPGCARPDRGRRRTGSLTARRGPRPLRVPRPRRAPARPGAPPAPGTPPRTGPCAKAKERVQ